MGEVELDYFVDNNKPSTSRANKELKKDKHLVVERKTVAEDSKPLILERKEEIKEKIIKKANQLDDSKKVNINIKPTRIPKKEMPQQSALQVHTTEDNLSTVSSGEVVSRGWHWKARR